jgi:hypothetical protein
VIGAPITRVQTADLGRLVCLSGVLELVGSSCIDGVPNLVSVSVVDANGLRLICRSAGEVALRCHEQTVEVVGEIGVVVGSREDGTLWDGQAIRSLVDGDSVRARGILRLRPRPPRQGYRGPAQRFALEAFGGMQIVDIASEKRPRGISSRDMRTLEAWAETCRARERRITWQRRVIVAPGDL